MFTVRYIYSACIVIETGDCKILCDPWFTDGIYDGAWYQFPKVDNPIEVIGDVDFIYISHIHPDHYDPIFLKQYFEVYGEKKIFIPDYPHNNFLQKKGNFDGFELNPTKDYCFKDTKLTIFPQSNTGHDIDSALLVSYKGIGALNLNDCGWEDKQVNDIRSVINSDNLDLRFMACSYTAAGPYPQTYYDVSGDLMEIADKHSKLYIQRYLQFSKEYSAPIELPFAGAYLLGGKNAVLNKYRAVIDPIEIKHHAPNAVVLKEGNGEVDLVTLSAKNERFDYYGEDELDERIAEISGAKYDYETEIKIPAKDINWPRIVPAAYKKALAKSNLDYDYYFAFKVMDKDKVIYQFDLNANSVMPSLNFGAFNYEKHEQYSEIIIDYRYLFGLITTIYHWNNAEVGSQFFTRRNGEYDADAQGFLTFLAIG